MTKTSRTGAKMNLSDFLTRYASDHQTGLADSTVEFYKSGIHDFEKYLGRSPIIQDLSMESVNKWLAYHVSAQTNAETVLCKRRAIVTLWRAAAKEELVEAPDLLKLRKIRRPKRIVQAWTKLEMQTLVDHIGKLPDRNLPPFDLSHRKFFLSMTLAAYDSGLRLGDMLRIRTCEIRRVGSEGHLTIIQGKTGYPKTSVLASETMDAIDDHLGSKPRHSLVWPLWCTRRHFYREVKAIVEDSGIRHGTFRWVRRAGATHVEADHPGLGFLYAGHRDPQITFKHYIDLSQLSATIVAPTPLKRSAK